MHIMKSTIVILLVVFGMGSTMFLQRDGKSSSNSNSTKQTPIPATVTKNSTICAPSTPCGWSIYNPKNNLIIQENISNTYCVCSTGLDCVITEDDSTSKSFIYHCRPPQPDSEQNDREQNPEE